MPARALVGAGSAAGVFVAALLAVGGLPDVVPTSHRAHALTVLGRAGSEMSPAPTGGLAAPVRAGSVAGAAVQNAVLPWTEPTSSGDPRGTGDGADGVVDLTPAGAPDLSAPDAPDQVAAWMGAHGWSPFATLPDGYRATALRLASGPGRTLELDLEGADGVVVVLLQRGRLDPAVAEGWTAVDVEGGPVHLVSSTPRHGVWQSGDTVVSVVAEESDALLALVESYPPQPYDGGVTARLTRGLDVLAGAWKP